MWSVDPSKGVTEMLLGKLRRVEGREGEGEGKGDDEVVEAAFKEEERAEREEVRRFSCTSCSSTYTHSLDLDHHVLSDHSTTEFFRCHDCTKSFTTSKALQWHAKASGHRPFDCGDCDMAFDTVQDLLTHAKVSGHAVGGNCARRMSRCGECGKGYYGKENWKRHVRVSGHGFGGGLMSF